jgi:hypothetical protein
MANLGGFRNTFSIPFVTSANGDSKLKPCADFGIKNWMVTYFGALTRQVRDAYAYYM